MSEIFELPFGCKGIKVPSYHELPHPEVPKSIQITVGVPVWNRGTKPEICGEPIVRGCVESILGQKFPKESYEVILVDDASNDDSWEAIVKLCEDYPNYNIRGYRRSESTTFNPGAPFNIAMTQGKGWIYVFNQPDLVWPTENFEAIWRHHNAREKLYLVPKNFGVRPEINDPAEAFIARHEWAKLLSLNLNPWHFPHEWGASIRMNYLHQIRGYDERLWLEPCDVELFCRLNLVLGILFAEEAGHVTVHRNVPGIKRGGEGYINPNHVWSPHLNNKNLDGWGNPPKECVMTETMKRVLK